jgi:YD repeat-containing protein
MIPTYLLRWRRIAACVGLLSLNAAYALEPIPSFYQEPGISRNRDYINQQLNEHIDPFTGKLQLHYVDLFISGNGGMDIKVQRSYNSQDELLNEPTVMGVGWTMHFGRVLRRAVIDICSTQHAAANAPVLELPDGSRQILYLSLDQSHTITTNRYKAVCAPGQGLIVFSPDGLRYEMTTQGQVTPAGVNPMQQQNSFYATRIVDKNGNALNLTYTTVGAVTSVSQITSSDGRAVTFNYQNGVLATVTDGTRTWSYAYDTSISNHPFLTQVTRPDGQSWTYSYNLVDNGAPGTWSMNQLIYPTGGGLEYVYGFMSFNENLPRTTVVTRKTGVGGVWKFSYNPATKFASLVNGAYQFVEDGMMDRTFVTAPDGVRTYMHVGANSVGSGAIYSIGLLLFKSTDGGYQNEGYLWGVQVISNTINQRPGTPLLSDGAVGATIPALTHIVRNGQVYATTYSNHDEFGNARTVVEQGTTTNAALDTRTTQRTFNVIPDKWLLRLPKDETVSTIGTINRTYDPNGNLLTENKYGVLTQFTYTPEGDLATRKDARNNTITYSQYKRGIAQSEVHPEAVTITRLVDDAGNVSSQTDGEGATTTYAYDGLNRLTQIARPLGNPVTITWGQISRVVQRGSYRESTTFDAYGRATNVQVDGGVSGSIVQTHRYDPLNRRIFSSYFNQTTGTSYQYDPLGRLFSTGHVATPTPQGAFNVAGGSRRLGFFGKTVVSTNERGFASTLVHRGFGDPDRLELMELIAPDPSASVLFTRNGLGQVLSAVQAGKTRTNVYDNRFFLTASTNPEVGTTLFGRDEVGNMTSRSVGTSGTTTFVYDGRNRVTSVLFPAGTPSVTKTYFKDDLVRTLDNGVTRREYFYSPNKMLTRETLDIGGTLLAADYGYNANDALQSMTYSTGLLLSYGPDGLGRATQAMPFANTVAFQPNGLLRQIVHANGVVSDFQINARQWPSNVTLQRADASGILNLSNVYDFAGNVTSMTETVQGQQNRTLSYDPLDRVTGVTMPGVTGGTIGYDGAGNIVSQQLGSTVLGYQYDTSNKLTSVSGSRNMSFSYDVYGNVTANSRNQFQYDDASVLRCVDCGTPDETRYVYDGAGTRVSEQKGTLMTYFMYGAHGDLLFEVDSNAVKREYGYVAGRNIARRVTQ